MDMRFQMPVDVIMRKNCVVSGGAGFAAWGNRAVILAERPGAARSGALRDVVLALKREEIAYTLLEWGAGEEPAPAALDALARETARCGANMVVAVGAESTLAAGKALARAAGRPEGPLELLTVSLLGAGAEVTPLPGEGPRRFPRAAFLDYRYARRMPQAAAVSAAFGALGRAVDAYLAEGGSQFVRAICRESLSNTAAILSGLGEDQVDDSICQMLLYGGALAGMAAGQTGPGTLCRLGEALAGPWQMSRGCAAGLLLAPWLGALRGRKPYAVECLLASMGLSGLEDLRQRAALLLPPPPVPDLERAEDLAELAGLLPEAARRELLRGL